MRKPRESFPAFIGAGDFGGSFWGEATLADRALFWGMIYFAFFLVVFFVEASFFFFGDHNLGAAILRAILRSVALAIIKRLAIIANSQVFSTRGYASNL